MVRQSHELGDSQLSRQTLFFSHYAQAANAIEWIMISVLKWIISFTLKSI